jgi:membrane protein YqaA with SNARE-associated domain
MLAMLAGVPWKKIGIWLVKANAWLLAMLKPLGAFGVLIVAIIDSSTIPMPLDAMVVEYVVQDHAKFLIYCFTAALGAAVGSLLPYYLGRAGGELFLLKRINRARYEQLRDRFEKQEFLALLIPSMMPPPTPWKLFVFGAGVFEMKIRDFLAAVFLGRLIRFSVVAFVTIHYGPGMVHVLSEMARKHLAALMVGLGVVLLVVVVAGVRKGMKKQAVQV